jgi:hypothetical protein
MPRSTTHPNYPPNKLQPSSRRPASGRTATTLWPPPPKRAESKKARHLRTALEHVSPLAMVAYESTVAELLASDPDDTLAVREEYAAPSPPGGWTIGSSATSTPCSITATSPAQFRRSTL